MLRFEMIRIKICLDVWPLNIPEHGIDTLETKKSKKPCDFFLWGYVKYRFYSSTSCKCKGSKAKSIITAVAGVDEDKLQCGWNELDYCIVCPNLKTYWKPCKYFGNITNTLVSNKM
jgi:hypothetical protein